MPWRPSSKSKKIKSVVFCSPSFMRAIFSRPAVYMDVSILSRQGNLFRRSMYFRQNNLFQRMGGKWAINFSLLLPFLFSSMGPYTNLYLSFFPSDLFFLKKLLAAWALYTLLNASWHGHCTRGRSAGKELRPHLQIGPSLGYSDPNISQFQSPETLRSTRLMLKRSSDFKTLIL